MNQKGSSRSPQGEAGFATPLLILIVIIFIIIFSYFFLTTPHTLGGNPVKPFKKGELLLSEKITYLFRKPEVGDRVIFFPNTRGIDFVGIITNVEEKEEVKTYTVISGGTNPWVITQDKIMGRIYYPFVSKEEVMASLPPLPSPTTTVANPESSGSAETFNTETTETANWKTYRTPYFSIKYPQDWTAKDIKESDVTILSEIDLIEMGQDYANFRIIITVRSFQDKPGFSVEPFEINKENVTVSPDWTKEDITIDGASAIRARSKGNAGVGEGSFYGTNVYIRKGGLEYFIIGGNYRNPDFNKLDQIISTFKLLP